MSENSAAACALMAAHLGPLVADGGCRCGRHSGGVANQFSALAAGTACMTTFGRTADTYFVLVIAWASFM